MKISALIITSLFFAAMLAFAEPVDGSRLFYEKCIGCHGALTSLKKTKSLEDWKSVIKRMKGHGAKVSSKEIDLIAEFLVESKK